jgi:hypothetical protein
MKSSVNVALPLSEEPRIYRACELLEAQPEFRVHALGRHAALRWLIHLALEALSSGATLPEPAFTGDRFVVRVPEELKDRIVAEAEMQGCSQSELVSALLALSARLVVKSS